MVMFLPSRVIAPSAANSFRQRWRENFWMAKLSAISCRDFFSVKDELPLRLDSSSRKMATFSRTVWSVKMRTFLARKLLVSDSWRMKLIMMRSSSFSRWKSIYGDIRMMVVGLLVSMLTGNLFSLVKMKAGAGLNNGSGTTKDVAPD